MNRLIGTMIISCLVVASPVHADWLADSGDKVQVKSQAAIAAFRDRVPRTEMYFEQAYGYAIFPSVTRVGLGFGGAYGKGIVVEGSAAVGSTKYWQFTSGIQAGARNFSMIVFFKDKAALEDYQASKTQFMGQAGIAFATKGVAGTPAYNDGVFSYKPLQN
jgi:lipid-binding SYLF domain-containing protein